MNFEIYKATQRQLVKTPFVSIAALRKPKVAGLRMVQRQADPVAWLARELHVSFPGHAEIMEISLSGHDPVEVALLVNAVVDAYQDEVVNFERSERKLRLSELDRVHADKEDQVRNRRTEFKQLAERLGTGDSKALELKQEIALKQFSAYREELVKHQLALRRANGERHVKKALLETLDEEEVSEYELEEFAQRDPIARRMLEDLAELRRNFDHKTAIARPGTSLADTERAQRELQLAQQAYDKRREELLQDLRRKKIVMFEHDIKRLGIEIAIAEEQVMMLQEDVDRQRKIAEKFGESSVELDMMRAEIKTLDRVLAGIANERDRLRVELRAASRVTLVQPAEVPTGPDMGPKPTSDAPSPASEESPAARR